MTRSQLRDRGDGEQANAHRLPLHPIAAVTTMLRDFEQQPVSKTVPTWTPDEEEQQQWIPAPNKGRPLKRRAKEALVESQSPSSPPPELPPAPAPVLVRAKQAKQTPSPPAPAPELAQPPRGANPAKQIPSPPAPVHVLVRANPAKQTPLRPLPNHLPQPVRGWEQRAKESAHTNPESVLETSWAPRKVHATSWPTWDGGAGTASEPSWRCTTLPPVARAASGWDLRGDSMKKK